MNVLVCGSRGFPPGKVLPRLEALSDADEDLCIISGGAPGPDTEAMGAAQGLGLGLRVYMADWKTHGRQAGHLRNQRMIDYGKPNLVIAFWDGKSAGTRDMIRRSHLAGIPVEIISP